MALLSIITTSDGSHTIRNETTGDTYHSIHGAIQESNHVFIQSGLLHFLSLTHAKTVRILEVGFGSGLNAFLTLKACEKYKVEVDYVALETNPLDDHLVAGLNYSKGDSRFDVLHQADWHTPISISPNFSLTKFKQTIQAHNFLPGSIDLVYYDAFSPTSQPEMWTLEVFQKIKLLMATPSIFVTYCAKGQVKRDLKSAGFIVESIPGPPGKREMVRAKVGC